MHAAKGATSSKQSSACKMRFGVSSLADLASGALSQMNVVDPAMISPALASLFARDLLSFAGKGSGTKNRVVVMKTVPIWIRSLSSKDTKGCYLHVLLDDGAAISLVSTNAIRLMTGIGKRKRVSLRGVGGVEKDYNGLFDTFEVRLENGETRKFEADVIPNPLGKFVPFDFNRGKHAFPHMRDLTFPNPTCDSEFVEILIGNDNSFFLRAFKEWYGPSEDNPVARLTPFGLTAYGDFASELVSWRGEKEEPKESKNAGLYIYEPLAQ